MEISSVMTKSEKKKIIKPGECSCILTSVLYLLCWCTGGADSPQHKEGEGCPQAGQDTSPPAYYLILLNKEALNISYQPYLATLG